MSVIEIGCCGAYCGTCKAYLSPCKGCKTGYEAGGRDIAKAKCAIKRCCMSNGFSSCADCADAHSCDILQSFYNHKGYKYGKYRQATEYISRFGYDAFSRIAADWSNAYGRYPDDEGKDRAESNAGNIDELKYHFCETDDFRFVQMASDLSLELSSRYGDKQAQYEPFNKVKSGVAMVVMDRNLTVACGCFRPYDDATVEIKRMYVTSQYRGKGIARELLARLEIRMAALGYRVAILETGCKQPEAIRLYEKSGYERTPNYGPYVNMPDSVCFKKNLGPIL